MGYFNDASLDFTADDAAQGRRDGLFGPGDLIFAYTRAQAIADGVLIDVTEQARQVGFRFPVAVTAALWADIQAVPIPIARDEASRLWDVLWLAAYAVREATGDRAYFMVELPVAGRDATGRYTVCAVCGPGDDGAPVITLMRPNED